MSTDNIKSCKFDQYRDYYDEQENCNDTKYTHLLLFARNMLFFSLNQIFMSLLYVGICIINIIFCDI